MGATSTGGATGSQSEGAAKPLLLPIKCPWVTSCRRKRYFFAYTRPNRLAAGDCLQNISTRTHKYGGRKKESD
jgi:hypothetical protein